MKCKYCKRQIPDESIFCMFCGEKVVRRRKKKDEVSVPKPRQLPSGSFFAQLTIDGERYSITEPTEQEYYARARAMKLGLLKAKKKSPALPLGKAIDNYLSEKDNILSPSTLLGYQKMRKNRFKDWMDKDIHSINWNEMLNEEAGKVSAKTVSNAWSLVHASVTAAGVDLPEITLPQIVKKEKVYLEPKQIPVFIAQLTDDKFKLPALLALNGLRYSEVRALQWEDIDLKNNKIHVAGATVYGPDYKLYEKEENKNQTSRRYVPILLPELRSALEAVEDKTGPVTTVSQSSLYKYVNGLCEAAELPLVGIHGLRHSFASLCYHQKVPELIAMRWGGWSSPDILRYVYTHIPQSDIDASAANVIDFFNAKAQITNEITNGKEKV